ncbi:hypothetical protein [Croceicoccus pelagius]|uniref:Uncharacterized protein n=1 Tax=Croceicoccus pelagius TaxID=1703341 RepID=A0A917DKG1_9SPHN|nr:hypothetical protein [Croceicoccus pelagius]GGD44615.1 hypothetical protein GCM10010989_18410 [Croceicoccus pelagius]
MKVHGWGISLSHRYQEGAIAMNLNQLLHNHQRAKLNARQVRSSEDRETYFDLVGYYAKRITDWRRTKGLSDIGWPRDERPNQGVGQ